jgi:hypothetical protein
MTQPNRLDLELADALGLTQAVRAAAAAAGSLAAGKKAHRALARIDADLDPLQEAVNERVVSGRDTRTRLTGRSRRLRDASGPAPELDAIDALQLLVADAAHALSQWQVVRRLGKAAGDGPARRLAKRALPLAETHLAIALKEVDRAAKRQAKAPARR